MRIRISAVLFLVSLAVGAAAPLSAQSLADVARQEEARRQAIRAPAKVITNTDLKEVLPPEPAPAPSTTTTSATPDSAAASGDASKTADPAKPADAAKPAGEPVKDQAYWSGRLKGLQTQLDRDQTFAGAVQVQIDALRTDFVNRDDPAQRAAIAGDRQRAVDELDRLNKQIVTDQQAITDLMEDARRAGVPPGWLR